MALSVFLSECALLLKVLEYKLREGRDYSSEQKLFCLFTRRVSGI